MPRTDLGFTSSQASIVTGLTRRQLGYWRKTGLVVPSRHTQGGHVRYSFTDLVALRTAKQLLDAAVSLRHIRQSIASLQQLLPTLAQPLAELSIVATGDVVLVFHKGAAFEAVSGQEWILPLAELQRKLTQLGMTPLAPTPRQGELFAESLHRTGGSPKQAANSLGRDHNPAKGRLGARRTDIHRRSRRSASE
ncbi:MAG: MerR family transcriptional regulator [Acidiferrobacterales bacterium]